MKDIIKCKKLIIDESEFLIPLHKEDIEKTGIFTIMLLIKDDKIIPCVSIKEETAEEDFDYDWEDNLVPNGLIKNIILHPIEFNPYTGNKFDFVVDEIIDKSNEYNEIIFKIEELDKKRKSRAKDKAGIELSNQLNELYKDIPPIFNYVEDNECYVLESEVLSPQVIVTKYISEYTNMYMVTG